MVFPTAHVFRGQILAHLAKHWGETGGTPKDKDGEIRVKMGKSGFQARLGRRAPTGVSARGCVETEGLDLAPQVGLEPTTLRLTAECSTIELLRSNGRKAQSFYYCGRTSRGLSTLGSASVVSDK